MKTQLVLLFLSLTMFSAHICNGMEKALDAQDKKKKSKSHVVKSKVEKKEEIARRKSASEVEILVKGSVVAPEKRRTFSLFRKKTPLKQQSKSADATHGDTLSASVLKTLHASVAIEKPSLVDALGAESAGALAVLSREVGKPAQEVAHGDNATGEKSNTAQVQLPNLNARREVFHTSKEIVVQPQAIDETPELNTAKKILARKPSLLRVMLKRSGRDSQTEYTAKEYLGELGKGALFPNLSPDQSPRSEDTVSQSNDSAGEAQPETPRSEDTLSPRVDDDSAAAKEQTLEKK